MVHEVFLEGSRRQTTTLFLHCLLESSCEKLISLLIVLPNDSLSVHLIVQWQTRRFPPEFGGTKMVP